MFYQFRQNNSGGYWVGPKHIIIEADDLAEANSLAPNYGIYFDGCRSGRDCNCCGDRWSELTFEDGDEVPSSYERPLPPTQEEFFDEEYSEILESIWSGEEEFKVCYKDGREVILKVTKELVKKAKERKQKKTSFIWGFHIWPSGVSNLGKYYESDYSKGQFWDAGGNRPIEHPPGLHLAKDSNRSFSGYGSYRGKDESDAREAHEAFVKLDRELLAAKTILAKELVMKHLDRFTPKERLSLRKFYSR